MSNFDQISMEKRIIQRLTNGHGFSEPIAKTCAAIAVESLRDTHAGSSIYISARNTDYSLVRADYATGRTIGSLARKYGVTVRRIRQIVNNTARKK